MSTSTNHRRKHIAASLCYVPRQRCCSVCSRIKRICLALVRLVLQNSTINNYPSDTGSINMMKFPSSSSEKAMVERCRVFIMCWMRKCLPYQPTIRVSRKQFKRSEGRQHHTEPVRPVQVWRNLGLGLSPNQKLSFVLSTHPKIAYN